MTALVDVVLGVVHALRDARDELNRLDGVAGDGDLGLTASRAADALEELAPTLSGDDPAAAARSIGMTLARKAPSTGGTLIAFACLAAAKAELPPDAPPLAAGASLAGAARDEIARRGKVALGDRTLLDALGPAADALAAAAAIGRDLARAAADAARAADQGARSTAAMAATTGRAGWLAERARGHEDAGARLVAVVFDAAARALGSGGRVDGPA